MTFLRQPDHIASVMISIVLLNACPSWAQSCQNEPYRNGNERPAEDHQRAAGPPPPSLQKQPAAKSADATPSDKKRPEGNRFVTLGAVEWSAIVQAISAFIVTIFTGLLVWYSHRGWTVAKAAAEAANKGAAVAAASLALTQRGYLKVEGWNVAIGEDRTIVSFEFSVDGSTRIDVDHGEIRMSIDDPPMQDGARASGAFTAVIGARRVYPRERAATKFEFGPLTTAQRIVLTTSPNPLRIFFSGEIWYRDAFQGTPKHCKHFGIVVDAGRRNGPLWSVNAFVRNDEEDED